MLNFQNMSTWRRAGGGTLGLLRGGLRDLRERADSNLPMLDVLRSCAILSVFTGHAINGFNAKKWAPIGYYGWTGVDLFFVLSGFLIGTQLLKELIRTGNVRVGRFLIRRGFRIWPLYTGFLILIAAEIIFLGRDSTGYWANVAYLSNYTHGQIAGSWSLSTEEQFYIVAPLLLVAFRKLLKPAQMWLLPVGAIACLNLGRIATVYVSTVPEAQLRQQMYFPLHTHSDGLAIGVFLAWLSLMHPTWIRSAVHRWSLAAGAVVLGVLLYRVKPSVTNFTVLALIYGAAVLLGMAATRVPGIFKWHGFYIISRLSYGMYLNHFGLLDHVTVWLGPWEKRGGDLRFLACYALSLILSIGIAVVTFLVIEWPFLHLRSLWSARSKRLEMTAASA